MKKNLLTVVAIALSYVACVSAKQTATAQASGAVALATGMPAVTYRVKFDTTAGPFVVAVMRNEAPLGADRFLKLVKAKYFDGARFYRVVPNFVVQFGAAADPKVTKAWDKAFADDPVVGSNTRGTITFATSGPNSRTTHVFINLVDNQRLDGMGFAPFGVVTSGMNNLERIYSGYGEEPDQTQIGQRGNAYLKDQFPRLDYIKSARVVPK